MSARIVAIHQPNFFPWLGYFKKVQQADVFVFLDNVEGSRGDWTNRVKLRIGGEARWVTCPIHLAPLIHDITIAGDRWKKKLCRSLAINYPLQMQSWVMELINCPEENLARYNIFIIKAISEAIGLESTTRFVYQSDLCLNADLRGSMRLIEICRLLDATGYLAGDGARAYEDVSLFDKVGIEYHTLSYSHPVYRQSGRGDFIYGLSILDAVLNIGIEKTKEIL